MNKTLRRQSAYTDEEIIARVNGGQTALFELLIRRTNDKLYRLGRSYGFNHQDTEDLMQEAHVDAYMHLAGFEQRASYATWISRLMLNRCAQRLRKRSNTHEIPTLQHAESALPVYQNNVAEDPAQAVMKNELTRLIENALVDIPVNYRVVFTLRELNQLSVKETALALSISEENVKVRLNRAKAMLRKKLEAHYKPEDIFEFNLVHCDAMAKRVMAHVSMLS